MAFDRYIGGCLVVVATRFTSLIDHVNRPAIRPFNFLSACRPWDLKVFTLLHILQDDRNFVVFGFCIKNILMSRV